MDERERVANELRRLAEKHPIPPEVGAKMKDDRRNAEMEHVQQHGTTREAKLVQARKDFQMILSWKRNGHRDWDAVEALCCAAIENLSKPHR